MTTPVAEIASYLDRVRAALADLPAADRDELLDDLESHLAEVAGEDDGSLVSRLGPPEQYADELRSSAGLPIRGGPAPRRSVPDRLAEIRQEPQVRQILEFLPQLRPGWWVLRGVLVAWLLVSLVGGLVLILPLAVLAVPLSVGLGRRSQAEHRTRRAALVVDVLIVALALYTLAAITSRSPDYVGDQPAVSGTGGLVGPAGPVTNIYPYAKDGTPLRDVLLYDQFGQPVVVQPDPYGPPGTVRQFPYAADGHAIENAYPQDQATPDVSTDPPVLRRQSPPSVTTPEFATATPTPATAVTSAPPTPIRSPVPSATPTPR